MVKSGEIGRKSTYSSISSYTKCSRYRNSSSASHGNTVKNCHLDAVENHGVILLIVVFSGTSLLNLG